MHRTGGKGNEDTDTDTDTDIDTDTDKDKDGRDTWHTQAVADAARGFRVTGNGCEAARLRGCRAASVSWPGAARARARASWAM
ncbi:hypothetical protein KEM52_006138 [Ascosphaera acerosa]|nr:hypothetical protein KEM52_006138 [Ascosphaera acerosa]